MQQQTVRPALHGITVKQLMESRGVVVRPSDNTTPLIIRQWSRDQNPPIHVIVEDSSWNICRDNSKECYDFKNMHLRLKQDDDERLQQQELFNEEPPLAHSEVECLLTNWLAFITDSARRKGANLRNLTFHELTVPMLDELAKKKADDPENKLNITEEYKCTIILTAKTPQKFWADLYNEDVAYNDGNRVHELIRNHFNFVLVTVSRLPIQWYHAKKHRGLPQEWWASAPQKDMLDWQKARYESSYSIPMLFLDRSSKKGEPFYDVVFNYMVDRHLTLLNDLLMWRFKDSPSRNIKVWWETLQNRGYWTNRGGLIQHYKGRSPSPYTFIPSLTYGTTNVSAQTGDYDGESGDEGVEDEDVPATQSTESKSLDRKDAVVPVTVPTQQPQAELDPSLKAIPKIAEQLDSAMDQVLDEKPDYPPAAVIWADRRKQQGLPDASDSKAVTEYLRRLRNALIEKYHDEDKINAAGKVILSRVLNDTTIDTLWADKIAKNKGKHFKATDPSGGGTQANLSVAGRASAVGAVEVEYRLTDSGLVLAGLRSV